MNYTDQQIEAATRVLSADLKLVYPYVEVLDLQPAAWLDAMRAALATLTPSEDPDLHTWTPADGPLTRALAGLPIGHPVTVTRTLPGKVIDDDGSWATYDSKATSASWLPAAPAWDGALVVAAETKDGGDPGCLTYLVRNRSGLYAENPHQIGITATEAAEKYGRIRVLIDAAGLQESA